MTGARNWYRNVRWASKHMNRTILEGAPNFRDLGGVSVRDGRLVRCGRLFRSQHLGRLTDRDLDTLRTMNVRLVCDLRSETERERLPSRLPEGMALEVIALHVSEDVHAGGGAYEFLQQGRGAAGAFDMMREMYRRQPRAMAGKLPQLFDRLADSQVPAIVHCFAGKDRTGFVCALVLHALGATREAIFADYLTSEPYLDAEAEALTLKPRLEHRLDRPILATELGMILGVQPEYLQAALDAIADEYGDLDAYLERAAGLTAAKRAAMQTALLE
ncbi:tyrosine-protein phosphatase [Azoarcus sp. DN11]|uniref:tyrosine-protein phosphatase n=1 Tax=Azoarcus sp. DN11 TaxID=356837 RepID=UPI0013E2BB5B|nr:tyrosine-protein phosphatase [Azoarcus sp. DN11]